MINLSYTKNTLNTSKIMKIGIVTQPLSGNYGGILQNFALQQVLKKLGHDPITFDYIPGHSGFSYLYHALRYLISFLSQGRFPSKFPKSFGRQNNLIDDFVEQHISCSNPFGIRYSKKLIGKYCCQAVIVGSDQVWRPQYNERQLDNQFLRFCRDEKVKKISYAASFGSEKWEFSCNQANKCAKLLKRFDAVSVRECSGLNHLERLGRTDGIQVLDPTLILGRDGFEKSLNLNDENMSKKRYLGLYILDRAEEVDSFLNVLKSNLNLEDVEKFQENTVGMGPTDWIKVIKYSSFMITDSFHGTVFCILYHIPFITIVNNDRGADRFNSLLEPLGLTNRLINKIDKIQFNKIKTIDWDSVENLLRSLRKTSFDFLKKNLD